MQDLTFAVQSRRTVERWQAALPATGPSVTLVRPAYSAQEKEVAGKAMDFSPQSVRLRWNAGYDDGRRLVDDSRTIRSGWAKPDWSWTSRSADSGDDARSIGAWRTITPPKAHRLEGK